MTRSVTFGPTAMERMVLALFRGRRKRWTADKASKKLGCHVLSIRPVFSTLTVPRIDDRGNVLRPAYLRKTDRVGGKSILGNPQLFYERLPDQHDMSEYWS